MQLEHLKSEDLWINAKSKLSAEEQTLIDFNQIDRIATLESAIQLAEDKKRQCLSRRWRIRRGQGRYLILRDVFEKIVGWIQRFKEVGDIAVQYDPAHASLPWAGVRLLLEITIKDTQIFGAMLEGLETIASLLPRYTIFEDLYLQRPYHASERLKDSLTTLYSNVLIFLAKNIHFFGKGTMKRAASSILNLTDSRLDGMMQDIKTSQLAVEQDARLVDAERQQAILHGIDLLSVSSSNWPSAGPNLGSDSQQRVDKLSQLMEEMNQPLTRLADRLVQVHDSIAEEERLKIFRWLSTIPVDLHHQTMQKGRLDKSGLWLLDHPDFENWASASYSSILWVHGSPGTGKSKLMSIVIDEAITRQVEQPHSAPTAYFYCARDAAEPERADPESVLLSIARQLSGTDITQPICDATVRRYAGFRKKGLDNRKLSRMETVALILELLDDSPATFVIDALDECDPSRRHELFSSLDHIIQNSANVVKVLVSSRDDGDILSRLEASPNVYISAQYNSNDICRFIHHEVFLAIEDKRLLNGRVGDNTRHQIVTTLQNGAQGMFRWVSLQLQNLCDSRRIKVERDLLEELGQLPKTLSDLYDRIYTEILSSAKHSRSIGIQILTWLRVAHRTLRISEIIGAVAIADDDTFMPLTIREVLDMTCNLVIEDRAGDCLRFAHLSVREFLDSRSEFSDDHCHRRLAERCLCSYTIYHALKDPLSNYAMLHWADHYAALTPTARTVVLHTSLIPFLFQKHLTSPSFAQWMNDIRGRINRRRAYSVEEVYGSNAIFDNAPWYDPAKGTWNQPHSRLFEPEQILEASLIAASSPFLLACVYGLREVLELQVKTQAGAFAADLNAVCGVSGSLFNGYNGLHIAVYCGNYDLVDFLINVGLKSSSCTARGESPLHIAVRRQYPHMVRLLLQRGANPNAISYLRKPTTNDDSPAVLDNRLLPIGDRDREIGTRSSLGFRQRGGNIVSAIDDESEAPIHLAAREGDKPCLTELLQNGADVNAPTSLGSTALHIALLANRMDILEMLLAAGADVHRSIAYDRTPLHLAAAAGTSSIVALLLRYNANPHKRDQTGSSTFDVARLYGHASVTAQLEPLLDDEASSSIVRDSTLSNRSSFLAPPPPTRPPVKDQLSSEAQKDKRVFQSAVTEARDDLAAHGINSNTGEHGRVGASQRSKLSAWVKRRRRGKDKAVVPYADC